MTRVFEFRGEIFRAHADGQVDRLVGGGPDFPAHVSPWSLVGSIRRGAGSAHPIFANRAFRAAATEARREARESCGADAAIGGATVALQYAEIAQLTTEDPMFRRLVTDARVSLMAAIQRHDYQGMERASKDVYQLLSGWSDYHSAPAIGGAL